MATGKIKSMEEFTVTLAENTTGTIYGRRSGRVVWIALVNVKCSDATGSGWVTVGTIPSAHCPEQSYLYGCCYTVESSTVRLRQIRAQSNTGLRINNIGSGEGAYGWIVYMS